MSPSLAEGSQLAGALFKGNPAAPPTHHDDDEDGSLSSGMGHSSALDFMMSCIRADNLSWLLYLLSRLLSQTAAGYTIPVGHQVCVSPTVNHRLHDTWVDRMEFKPDRYLNDNPAAGEKFAYVPFGAGMKKRFFLLL